MNNKFDVKICVNLICIKINYCVKFYKRLNKILFYVYKYGNL